MKPMLTITYDVALARNFIELLSALMALDSNATYSYHWAGEGILCVAEERYAADDTIHSVYVIGPRSLEMLYVNVKTKWEEALEDPNATWANSGEFLVETMVHVLDPFRIVKW